MTVEKKAGVRNKLILAALVALAFLLIKLTGLSEILNLESLQGNRDRLLLFVEANAAASVLLYIAAYILVAGLSIPGATILTLAGGFAFGALPAALYVNIGATTGAAWAFLITRYLAGDLIQNRYGERLRAFNTEMDHHGQNYLLTVRFIPLFPFFLVNIAAGMTRIPLSTFLWTTSVGILPGGFVYTYAGSQLATIRSPGDILSGGILAAFALLALFSLGPVIYSHFRGAKKEGPA